VPYRGYALKEITLVPARERLPVEFWQPIQSDSARAFDFMAKYSIRRGLSVAARPKAARCSDWRHRQHAVAIIAV
jgi:hypothetical protein